MGSFILDLAGANCGLHGGYLGGGVTFPLLVTRRNWFWRRCGRKPRCSRSTTLPSGCNAAVPQCGRFLRFVSPRSSVPFAASVQVAVSLISWKSWSVCGSGVLVSALPLARCGGHGGQAAVGTHAVGTGVGW